uniref:Transmembrane protein n=1 Tax=Macrostomum lignano TaxID=282301 RepID=A0A1I8GEP0_9PLAT
MSAHFELDELSQSSESYTVVEVTVVEYSLNFLAVITLLLLIAIVAAAFKNVLVKDKSQASRAGFCDMTTLSGDDGSASCCSRARLATGSVRGDDNRGWKSSSSSPNSSRLILLLLIGWPGVSSSLSETTLASCLPLGFLTRLDQVIDIFDIFGIVVVHVAPNI